MKRLSHVLLVLGFLASCLIGPRADAQADAGVTSATILLADATTPQRDGSHKAMLLSLRKLDDPAMLPLFTGLSNSPYLTMRIHGRLGAASLSPTRRIDLSMLAEIDDPRELVQVLSAAIDDDYIDNAGMATLLTWNGLDLPLRQAIALRLLARGGEVDVTPFRVSLDLPINENTPAAKLLQYALAGLLLAEAGDEASKAMGRSALAKLATVQSQWTDAVIGQTLDAAMRQGYSSAGGLAMPVAVAKGANHEGQLRLLAIQSALRLGAPGAATVWQSMFRDEQSTAQRIRLAMIALDAAAQVEPAVFDTLNNQGEWIGYIAKAGRAIASQRVDASAFEPLIATGQPLSIQWIITHCQRDTPDYGPALLALVIKHHDKGLAHHRSRMTQVGIAAATAWCELYPDRLEPLLAMLATTRDDDLPIRQVALMGIANARGDLASLAKAVEPDLHNDFTTESLRLFIHARHGAQLTDAEWRRVSDIVQGVGNLNASMRLQLGWAYLKQQGQANAAITQALR